MVYFSDIFGIDESVLEDYGAFNISLLNDLPLFVDPFLLYASDKEEYKNLHEAILDYLAFLKTKAQEGRLNKAKIDRWYKFPEVKQVWFGYSETGNGGSGLGEDFANAMSSVIVNVFQHLRNESISDTSHLEKLSLFKSGVGRDNISDFTCNLIKKYLLEYTQEFARKYLRSDQCALIKVSKVYFDYAKEVWMPQMFYLPVFNKDYVILTPKDILTKDDNWINLADMQERFYDITASLPNSELRDEINDVYLRMIPEKPKNKDYKDAATSVVNRYPELMDYYIKLKEDDKDNAKKASTEIVAETISVYIKKVQQLCALLHSQTDFYKLEEMGTFDAARQRVNYLKDIIENKDGYRLFYQGNKPVSKEKDLQLLFKFVWVGTSFCADAEVNNGRGPADFKISNGALDSTIVEFKLAKSSKLEHNLQNQVPVYEAANNTNQSLKVIMYYNERERLCMEKILNKLGLQDNPNIIKIDASPKESASNVKS